MAWLNYNLQEPDYWADILTQEDLDYIFSNENWVASNDKEWLNLPCSFDIETSAWVDKSGKEHTCMYIWQMGIDGHIIFGRSYPELINTIKQIKQCLQLNSKKLIKFYVHNLGYEFQFIHRHFNFNKVFSIEPRSPIYAIDSNLGVAFFCSLKLSGGYSLENVGKKLLHKYPVEKLSGSLNYSLIRHQKTPLTANELAYCRNDVLVLNSYIQEKIESDGDIVSIPLTNTGYVRKYTRQLTIKQSYEYRNIINNLKINDEQEYIQLKRAFAGGFVHSSLQHTNKTLELVSSYDIKSSYPSTICLDADYPMSPFELIGDVQSTSELEYYLENYCCIFDIYFHNIRSCTGIETILTSSLERVEHVGSTLNNGKIISAREYIATITNIDYRSIQLFYEWDYAQVTNLRISKPGRLPREFVYSVLQLFNSKTKLDGVPGKEAEYMVSKNMLNSDYGMMVTNIIRIAHLYSNGIWKKELPNIEEQLNDYNNSFNRFLSYAWGVFVTSHARWNLFHAIYAMGEDYVYSDTDSVKILNYNSHKKYFEDYNQEILRKTLLAANELELPLHLFMPRSPSGEIKKLGTFEYEGTYELFKTLGAKRYCLLQNNNFKITVAGLNKFKPIPYIIKQACPWITDIETQKDSIDWNRVFDEFRNNLYIPPEYTGKLTSKYFDTPRAGIVKDYLGNTSTYSELSATYLGPCPFTLSLTKDYSNLLEGHQLKQI